MTATRALIAAAERLPAAPLGWVRSLYQRLPGWGSTPSYSEYGEDSFVRGYFHTKFGLTAASADLRWAHRRSEVGPGFFVDVGAHAPIINSNTYWFYRQGWRGINIDATPGSMIPFRRHRPLDVNIEAAVSDVEGDLLFYRWQNAGINTLSEDHARKLTPLVGREPETVLVPTRRLDSLLAEHLPAGQTISLLDVDVEGHDLHVLRSNDWDRYRPELLLVEDFAMADAGPGQSDIHRFMTTVGYEMYAWLRPKVVYRPTGLPDWLNPPSLTHQ